MSQLREKSIYIISGEVSGDMHGACLIKSLREQCPDVSFYGAGGPEMKTAGGDGITDWVEDAAVMGFWEVLKHYKWFKQKFDEMLAELLEIKPDVLVLIDYPGFNLRFAYAVKEKLPNVKIVYYISPQVWAWNKGRIPKMAKALDLMMCIFPFEKPIFEKAGLRTVFTGHPLVDELAEKREDVQRDEKLIGLFPGSREREIASLFPMMVETARRMHVNHPEVRFEAAAASEKLEAQMHKIILAGRLPDPSIISLNTGTSQSLMQRAVCGVVASGTATLEAAALKMPYCLVYKVAWPTWVIGKMLIKIEFIGIVNILAGKKVVEELIQGDAEPCQVEQNLDRLIVDIPTREALVAQLSETASKLGEPGAHQRAAAEVAKFLQ
ncbi:MAG: lipid-A-disaccharide synthase [Akkermansiaceae bacterium]